MRNILIILMSFCCTMACDNKSKSEQTDKSLKPVEAKESPIETKNSNRSKAALKSELDRQGYKTFYYIDEETQDTVVMQQYYMAFLKRGPIRSQNEEEAARLQKEHLAHLGKMYQLGYADISGPFGDDADVRGITIYNVPTLEMADSLANSDPLVKAGGLVIEIRPWWAGKGLSLR